MRQLVATTKVKDNYWQVIRGICILAVIMIHCPTGVPYGTESFEFKFWLIVRQLINFPVAIFIFLAGYFVDFGKCINNSYIFYLKRIKRLLIPFFIWSIIYSCISAVLTYYGKGMINFQHLFYNIIVGKAAPQLYFILVLLQLSLITPYLVKKIIQNSYVNYIFWLITPFYLIFVYLYNIKIGKQLPFYATWFPAWFIFYYVGLQIRAGNLKRLSDLLNNKLLLILAFLISVFEAFLLMSYTGNAAFSCSQVHFSCFFATLVMISLFNSHTDNHHRFLFLERIGNYSYGIFYVHYIFIVFIRRALKRADLDQFYLLYFITIFALAAVFSFLIVKYSNRFLQKNAYGNKVLGLLGFD